MKRFRTVCVLAGTFAAILGVAGRASAQETGAVELGSSLVDISVLKPAGEGTGVLVGVPSASFSIINPSVYAGFMLTPHVAVEPRFGLIAFSGGGDSGHLLNTTLQVDYFADDAKASTPYVFAGVGALSMSGGPSTPKIVSGGVGYRLREGDRLVLRFDGRYSHFTAGGGNMFSFTISIGGVFGK